MLCQVCKKEPSKYKCPKCLLAYCSIPCFKDGQHSVYHENHVKQQPTTQPIVPPPNTSIEANPKFDYILNDKLIQELLSYKSLQIHLLSLIKLASTFDSKDRKDLLNLKINDLRENGIEYNELIEEFITRFLYLEEEYEQNH